MAAMVTANEMARIRWARMSDAQKSAQGSKAAAAYWAKLTPKQRSAEMKRRARVRMRNRRKKS